MNNCSVEIKSRAKGENEYELRDVYINTFCFCIEVKSHPPQAIKRDGLNVLVKYRSQYHDATYQSERQKYSVVEFFKDRLGGNPPRVCNFIWLRNVTKDDVSSLMGTEKMHNILHNEFSFKWLFQLACVQHTVSNGPPFKFNSFEKDFSENADNVFEILEENKKGIGILSRSRIEKISTRLLKGQNYEDEIGTKMFEISGRAGTGKTMKLLRLAYDLAMNKEKRCLLLTYNHALVSDIRRMLAYAEVPVGIGTNAIKISTIHKFIYDLLVAFEINTSTSSSGKLYIEDFIDDYERHLKDIYELISTDTLDENDIQKLIITHHGIIDFDVVFIDEAQDWLPKERDILFKIFTPNRIIIASGKDQLIRHFEICQWTANIDAGKIKRDYSNKNMRQKKNLVDFVNILSNKFNMDWNLQATEELIGGKVKILSSDICSYCLNEEYDELCKSGNIAYDLLFLVPPELVTTIEDKNSFGDIILRKRFSHNDKFENLKFKIWDATDTELRSEYPVTHDESRLMQYDSCRGLEGWTVVCLNFDSFHKYKQETFKESSESLPTLDSLENKKLKFANLWSLIPLTRPIDTLIITLKDKNAYISKILKECSDQLDYVEWMD